MSSSNGPNVSLGESRAVFGTMAEKYEKSTGGATSHIARRLLALSPSFTDDSIILDNACGPGVITETLQQYLTSHAPDVKVRVYGADAAKPMVDVFQAKAQHAEQNGTWPNLSSVTLHAVPAEQLEESLVPSNTITHSYMNFGLFFCSDPIKAAGHIHRSLAPGGTAFITTWADLGWKHAMRKVEAICSPGKEDFKMPFSDQWEDPAYVKDVLVKSGFTADTIKVVQEQSYFRAKDMDELAMLHTELFSMMVKGPNGWESADAKKEWTRLLTEELKVDKYFVQEENGVATRMLANVAICTK